MSRHSLRKIGLSLLALTLAVGTLQASSHREAPGITKTPKVDGTDLYMFRSYEPGRSAYVTLLANYVPLQDVYGGPNFFMLDEDALYEIKIDNDGDAREDMTFQFKFQNKRRNITLNIGGKNVAVPLINVGRIGPGVGDNAALNVVESYTVDLVRGSKPNGRQLALTHAQTGERRFAKPVDRIGDKSIRDDANVLASVPPNDVYNTYADNHIHPVRIPGCNTEGRVFVGQRREGFAVNLAETFDLINTNPIGPRDGETNDLADKNITTLALELPIACLLARPNQPIIGAWTTASVAEPSDKGLNGDDKNSRKEDDEDDDTDRNDPRRFRQVSRLGNPLVNEVVIGLKDKDRFNASEPRDDAQFLTYVTNPTLPALIEALFGFAGVKAPTVPRNDLVQVFLTGVPGLNQPPGVVPSEMMRLNTSIPPAAPEAQNSLGVLGGDLAGHPNGRRPGDDVVDIALRAVMGVLLPASQAPSGQLPYTDGALVTATIAYSPEGQITDDQRFRLFRGSFPFLQVSLSGSPNPTHQTVSPVP
ncbi:MAG: DUF4331 domain-containing protein [Vicinamibacterales bacterium]